MTLEHEYIIAIVLLIGWLVASLVLLHQKWEREVVSCPMDSKAHEYVLEKEDKIGSRANRCGVAPMNFGSDSEREQAYEKWYAEKRICHWKCLKCGNIVSTQESI